MTLGISVVVIGITALIMMRIGAPSNAVLVKSGDDAIDGAIAVARRRLARGEIDAEDYKRIVSVLHS